MSDERDIQTDRTDRTDLDNPRTRPKIRWGGVVWGIILLAVSGFVLFTISSPANQYAFSYWLAHLTPGSGWTLAVVAVGAIILILALLAAVRSAQRKRRA